MGCGPSRHNGCQLQVITKQEIREHNLQLLIPNSPKNRRILKTKTTRETLQGGKANTLELGLDSLIDVHEEGRLRRVARN